ncbi:MAG: ABC transporter substrate-binding protein [Beijerinckiaceae bacterium]|nr:ABC transporter substrate-binding protein [Beijerinckiaceae bacterium]MCZ8299028.1 ABC transporter substrate-binding protein [Beijerinckiaceae bacterium]
MRAMLQKHAFVLLATLAMGLPQVAAEPARIVAAGGVVTETIHALGEAGRLVGVDSTSLYPADALQRLPNIGYVRALSAEGVLSLRPDLVLAIEGAGPPDVLALIRQAGIPVQILTEEPSEAGVLARIRAIGAVVGQKAAADSLADRIAGDFARLAQERARIARPKRVLFVLSMQNGRVMVAGRNSSAAAMIGLAGGINAVETLEGFKPVSDEGIIAAAPDVIVMMQRGDHAMAAKDLFAHPAFRLTPAATDRALITMDGLYLLGFGPRTADAARDLMSRLYPDTTRHRAEVAPRP